MYPSHVMKLTSFSEGQHFAQNGTITYLNKAKRFYDLKHHGVQMDKVFHLHEEEWQPADHKNSCIVYEMGEKSAIKADE